MTQQIRMTHKPHSTLAGQSEIISELRAAIIFNQTDTYPVGHCNDVSYLLGQSNNRGALEEIKAGRTIETYFSIFDVISNSDEAEVLF